MTEKNNKNLTDVLESLYKDPVLFVRTCLGVEPQEWQKEALEAISENNKVSIRSSHGVGKTTLLAWVILWMLLTRSTAKIPCTANSASQLEQVLWSEIKKWSKKLPKGFQDELIFSADKILMKNVPDSGCFARTAKKDNPEALQGFHCENLLFIVEEASGVDNIIFEVAQGAISSEGSKLLMVGNPTSTSGYFADSFGKNTSQFKNLTVSCYDSPMVSKEWIEDMKRQYGEESNVFRVRCLGLPPEQNNDSIISLHLLESAVERDVEAFNVAPIWGVDVARYGSDRSTLAKRKGNILVEPIKSWRDKDLMESTGIILAEYESVSYEDRPSEILVDSIGIGSGICDRLSELGLPARGINVAESPSLRGRYVRLRDELWFLAKEWLEARDCQLPIDEELVYELSNCRYSITSAGKFKIESKDELKKRGFKSPDLADAFVLTFASQHIRASGKSTFQRFHQPIEYGNSSWIV